MVLAGLSLGFIVLLVRDLRRSGKHSDSPAFDWSYRVVLLALAVACAWPQATLWRLERELTRHARQISGHPNATVHCNSPIDAMFDNDVFAIGHAQVESGEIVFQYKWCSRLMDYRDHPHRAGEVELLSMNLFTHEVMHVRGEYNEQRTECQSLQRFRQTAIALGVPPVVAGDNARAYYGSIYPRHPYFTPDCAPGGPLDERLPDPPWAR